MNIIFLGSPGSGKGTQAELISEQMGYVHISTGEMLRSIKDSNSEIKEIMQRGQMVPDEKVMDMVENYLIERDLFDNLILDGSPRNLYQYKRLKAFLVTKGKSIDLAISINISDEEVIRRLTSRRKDVVSGKTYNLVTNPPGPDVDPNNLIQREDDTEESVRQRLKIQKVPNDLVEELKNDRILYEINGEQSIDKIFDEVKTKINDVKTKIK